MGSTLPSAAQPTHDVRDTPSLRWRNWPLADRPHWSWLMIAGILSVAGLVAYVGESWLFAFIVAIGLSITLWQYFVPVDFEVGHLGLRQTALGRTRLVPWHAIQAYQPRATGVVLYQRYDPTKIDLLCSLFVPFPADADETLAALREQLVHAVELPE
jgi:hypothetical protein